MALSSQRGRPRKTSIKLLDGQNGSTGHEGLNRSRRLLVSRQLGFVLMGLVVLMMGALSVVIDRRALVNIMILQSRRQYKALEILLSNETVWLVNNPSNFTTLSTATNMDNAVLLPLDDSKSTSKLLQSPMVLDLLPWELQSIREFHNVTQRKLNRTYFNVVPVCQPPEGVPEACCLGSISSKGMVRGANDLCFEEDGRYHRVEQAVRLELQRTEALVKDSDECDVCRIMSIIYQHDLNFALTGDSVMFQVFSGLWCELGRRGYHIADNRTFYHDNYIGIRSVTTLEITGPAHWNKPVYVTYISQYKPMPDMSEFRQIASTYNILVMNFGVHWTWNRRSKFRRKMTALLNITKHSTALQLLVHREASAQHFGGGPAGEWGADISLFPCDPWGENGTNVEQFRWRDRFMEEIAAEVGYKVLVADESLPNAGSIGTEKELLFVPFYNLTVGLHYLHPGECTHFCSTPFLWMPIWRSLRLAMDRQWNVAH